MFSLLTLLIVAGVGVIGWSWWRVGKQKKAAADWPHVEGRITHCDITQRRDADGDISYLPDVRYAYVVNGAALQGSRVRFGLMRLDLGHANKVRLRYPVGSDVDVYYDPAQPGNSVLETANASKTA